MLALIARIDKLLAGWPDEIVSVLLVVTGVATICIGLFGSPVVKAFWLAYEVLP